MVQPSNSIVKNLPKRNETYVYKRLECTFHGAIIHNSHNLQTIQMLINCWLNKAIKKIQTTDSSYNVDEPLEQFTNLEKADPKDYIL